MYKSSREGFKSEIFYSKCDDVSATLTVIKSENSNIFGGFVSIDWSGEGQLKSDPTAYLFSLVNNYNLSVKMDIIEGKAALTTDSNLRFGSDDLSCTSGQCVGNCSYYQCYSYLRHSYKLPSFLQYGTTEANSFLGGSHSFQSIEIEVYWIDRMKFF